MLRDRLVHVRAEPDRCDDPDGWVALAIPDSQPKGIRVDHWNPTNSPPIDITHARFFAEVRARGVGLRRGVKILTARFALDDSPIDLSPTDDPATKRLGRRILHRHPVRRS